MNTKALYVLVSNKNDYFAEQAFLSIYSLKKQSPHCCVVLLVDDCTSEYLQSDFPELVKSATEYKVVAMDQSLTNKAKSRILKTTMREHVEGDFFYIDCDTVISGDLSEIDSVGIDLGFILDSHVPFAQLWGHEWVNGLFTKCGFVESVGRQNYYNGGICYCKDNERTHKFFKDWASLLIQSFESGITIDQPSLNHADTINGNIIRELPGKWNCQLTHGGVKFLHEAKIIHYFASDKNFCSPYLLAGIDVLKEIRKQKNIPDFCLPLIENPKSAIDVKAPFLSPEIPIEVFYHQPFLELVHIYRKHKFLYKILRGMAWLMLKLRS